MTTPSTAAVLPDPEIRTLLAERVDGWKQSIGFAVGVIDGGRRRVVAYGALAHDDTQPLDGDTVFEIGSITKVFTSLVLADMVERGDVRLDDPIARYLPASARLPTRAGRSITLLDLATHVSGLPRLPANLAPADPRNPYADYTAARLYDFLSTCELTRDIGARFEYSNLGGGLLGHVLACRAGVPYGTLIRERITGPLGMRDTGIELSPDLQRRLAAGHDQQLQPVPNWEFDALAGAGALRSTVNDLLIFLSAVLGETPSPLAAAIALTTKPELRRVASTPASLVGLGWIIGGRPGRTLVMHDGGTGGYRSFLAYDPVARTGVVVLSNSAGAGVTDLALHIVDRRSPLSGPPKVRTEIAVDPDRLDRLTGRYQLTPNAILTVSRDGSSLYAQLTGQPRLQLFASTETEFFPKAVNADITFASGDGPAAHLVLRQGGRDMTAPRID